MAVTVFNPDVLQFGIYSIPVVLAGVLTAALGLFVLVREQGSPVGRAYMLFAGAVAWYVTAAGISYAVTNPQTALLWDRIAHIGVMTIPYGLLGSSALILGLSHRMRVLLRAQLVVTVGLIVLLWTTPLIISGVERLFWAWYPQYGVGGIVFIAYFAAVFLLTIHLFTRALRTTVDPVLRKRLTLQLGAILIGAFGAMDFLPTVGVEMYAAGFVPITVFVVVIGYTIMRYRLLDITPELAAATILATMHSAVMVVDRQGIVRVANRRAHLLLGVDEPLLVNRAVRTLVPDIPALAEISAHAVPFREHEIVYGMHSGAPGALSVSADHLRDHTGMIIGTVYVGHDISRRKQAERELEQSALYDDLTGLPNRRLFFDRLDHALGSARRSGEPCALLFLDLDGFKLVNDTHGHQSGDAVLRAAAARIRSAIRDVDTVARMGGDEFVILCGSLGTSDDATVIAEKVEAAIREPYELPGGASAEIGTSIGIAIFPDDGTDPDTLLAQADKRMYSIKRTDRRGR